MRTEITKLYIDWKNIKNRCRTTLGKQNSDIEPNKDFRIKLLISEHSPIRHSLISWQWTVKSWVATHFSRHKWECYIQTQRSDRTGVNRDDIGQGAPVLFSGDANLQNLIDTSRKRLCVGSTSPETREAWESLKDELLDWGEDEIALVMVPNCVYRGGCPEFNNCGYYNNFIEWIGNRTAPSVAWGDSVTESINISNLRSRYEWYKIYTEEMRK